MADNTVLNSGSGGDTLATDDISGVKYPRSKMVLGADGTNDGDVSSSNPMPCKGTGTAGTANSGVMTVQGIASMTPIAVSDNSSSLTVDNNGTFAVQAVCTNAGTFAVQAVCTNAGTFAVQSAQSGSWTVSGTGTAGSAATGVMTVQGIASMTPVQVSQATASNLNATVVGTGTFAVQAACTNAGTFAVQVDGAALTALQLIDNAIYVDDADWTATSSSHTLIGGVYQSTPGTITDGDTGPLRVNANGALHVAIVSGAGSGGTASDDDADFTAGSTSGTPAMGVYESSPTSVTDGDLGVVGITATRAMRVYDNQVSDDVQSLINPIDDSYASSSKNGIFAGVIRKDTMGAVAGTDGDMSILQVDANGALRVTIDSFADDADFTATTTTGLPSMGVYESSPTSITDGDLGIVGLTQTRAMRVSVDNTVTVASHNVTNAGTFAVQVDGSALTALQLIDDVIFTDDAAFTPGTSKVAVIGAQCDDTATDSVDEGDAGALRMTAARQLLTVIQPHTAGGCSMFRSIDIDETEEEIKASAGQIYGIHCMNLTAALLYLKFYNLTAGNCTVGTSTPVLTFPVPGNGDTDGAGFTFNLPQGITFDTAISVACTTGVADADTGAPAANACVVNVFYK